MYVCMYEPNTKTHLITSCGSRSASAPFIIRVKLR